MEQTRVVVILSNDKDPKKKADPPGEFTFFDPASLPLGGQVTVLDGRTLRLLHCQNATEPRLLFAHKLRFDVLTTQDTGDEMAALLHCLFVERRDGFVIHLRVERECPLMFLLDTLVMRVKAKLQNEGLRLERGCVRFRKLLEKQRSGSNGPQTQCTFGDTQSLMLWLLKQYQTLEELSAGTGHEALEVEYVVEQAEQGDQFCVRLYVILAATDELSASSLIGLHCFFSDDPMTSSLVGSELVNFMQHAANRARAMPLYVLIMCHVVAKNSQVDTKNVQLLTLAHLVRQRPALPLAAEPSGSFFANSFAQLHQYGASQREIDERFRLVYKYVLFYERKADQLKRFCDHLHEQVVQFEELLNRMAKAELGNMLHAFEANLGQLNNFMDNPH